MLGVIFLSFSFQIYADRIVLFEYFFIWEWEFWGVYSLFEGSLHCGYVVFCWIVCPYHGLVYHVLFHYFDRDIRKITRRLECLHLKILKKKQSMAFNLTCLDDDLLSKYTIYMSIYIYIYIWFMPVYIYIYIYICNIHSASEDYDCGIFVYRIYDGFCNEKKGVGTPSCQLCYSH